MTNLQQGAPRISARLLRRLWLGLPVAAGGVLTALLVGSLLIPQWLAFRQDAERLRQLQALREEVTLLRGQLKVVDQQDEKGEAQKVRLVELVTGRGDPGTFLAMLDREARATGVQLDLYEPQAPSPVAPPPTPRQNPAGTPAPATGQPLPGANAAAPAAGAPAAPPGAPTEIEGLQRRTVLMAARGSYPALLNFLRRVEALSILVVQNNLNVSLEEAKTVDPKVGAKPPVVVLKLAFNLYTRPPEAKAAAAAAAPAAGAPPAATPSPPPR